MTSSTKPTANQPAQTLRSGSIRASIWQNTGERGTYYSVTFSRSYNTKDGKYRDTNSFADVDLLRLQYLAGQAFEATLNLERDAKPATHATPNDGRVA